MNHKTDVFLCDRNSMYSHVLRAFWLAVPLICLLICFLMLAGYSEECSSKKSIKSDSFIPTPTTSTTVPPQHHEIATTTPINPCFGLDMEGCKPYFLVIGAQKGGTTAMYNYLSQHPQIVRARDKEICTIQTGDYYIPKYYWSKFPNISNAQSLVTGEACPGYMLYPWSAQRAKKIVPNAKIILLLRDPVLRAFSQYQMFLKTKSYKNSGFKFDSFESLLNYSLPHIDEIKNGLEECREHNLINSECIAWNSNWYWTDIVLTSMYYYQLQHWMDEFPRDQIHIIQSERFEKDPVNTMDGVFSFLGLPSYKFSELKPVFVGVYQSKLTPETQKRLSDFFAPYNEELYQMIGWSKEQTGWS